MRYKTLLVNSLLQKGFFGLLLTSVIVFVLLQITAKYTFTLVDSTYTSHQSNITYADLNGDKLSERIEIHRYTEGKSSLIIKTNEQIIDQWNFDGEFAYTSEFMLNDYDEDGNIEIFVFTRMRDSLYMHGLDPMSAEIEFLNIPVCKLLPINGNYSFAIELIDFFDTDHDGVNEILFAVMTGFAKTPRNVFAYNVVSDRMTISPASCANLAYFIKTDLDRDSIPEYIPKCLAIGNCDSTETYSDMYSWLMVFEPDLTFKFPPQQTGSYPSITSFFPFKWNNEESILAMHDYRGSDQESDYLAVFDSKGKILHKRIINDPGIIKDAVFISIPSNERKPMVLNESGTLFTIDENLEMRKLTQLRNIQRSPPSFLDIDNDGELEIIFFRADLQGFVVYRNAFRHPATIQHTEIIRAPFFSAYSDNKVSSAISICLENQNIIYAYHKSPVHRYWCIFAVGIFLMTVAMYLFVLKIREFREMKKSNAQVHLAELQMRSIQNQLDPHFTFNILQSFGTLLNETNKEKAQYLFDKYADLLKTSVLNSDKVLVTLAEELDFVESYVLLERFRQQDRFEHQVEVSEEVDRHLQIPKMLIHIFVENAVKHGLRHRGPGGSLVISATREDGFIKISIRDNGIGREEAAKLARFSTGKGLGILDQILELYTLLHRKKINYYITDLKDGPSAVGTQVDIFIPE